MAAPDPSSAAAGSSAAGESESLFEMARALLLELPGLVSDRVELLALELERAGRALARIAVLGLALIVLVLTAWLALWAGIVFALTMLGLSPLLALALALLCNAAAVVVIALRVRTLAQRLALPATRRHLTLGAPPPSHATEAPARPAAPQG